MATYTEGYRKEIPDQTPVEMPLGYRAPETLEALIARLVRNQQTQDYITAQGAETFAEADDFDVDDDGEMQSPYEMTQMQEEYADEKARTLANSKGSSSIGRENMDDTKSEEESEKVEAGSPQMATEPRPKAKRGTQRRQDSTPRDNSDGGAE